MIGAAGKWPTNQKHLLFFPTVNQIMDPLQAIEEWYASVCNGDWEHSYGVKIETLDNPGWRVEIDLRETPLESRHLERVVIERTDDDWVHCWTENGKFNGAGGARNLSEILLFFGRWRLLESDETG